MDITKRLKIEIAILATSGIITTLIGLFALMGYAAEPDILIFYKWSDAVPMAPNTALAVVIIGNSLLVWAKIISKDIMKNI